MTEGRYFVIRGDSSVIAFDRGDKVCGLTVAASHTDTPAFKLTSLEEKLGNYSTLPVERYGGSILYTWLDRPLSVAGRVVVNTEEGLSVRLVNIDRDLLTIPSVAIHQNRGVNDGYKFNTAVDMLPLFSTDTSGKSLREAVSETAGVSSEDIAAFDLYVYNRERGRAFGKDGEFILAPRIDNLASVFTSLKALLSTEGKEGVARVFCAFDNEEVGSSTKQGANSTFLNSVLLKICGGEAELSAVLSSSFMVSLDNSHARHPNHPELSNSATSPVLGKGIAVKYNANQLYTTDAVSDAIIRTRAKREGIPLQSFATRADMQSGSTLGSIATTRVGIASVDLGIPQLAMHSASESMCCSDLNDAVALIKELYSAKITRVGREITIK